MFSDVPVHEVMSPAAVVTSKVISIVKIRIKAIIIKGVIFFFSAPEEESWLGFVTVCSVIEETKEYSWVSLNGTQNTETGENCDQHLAETGID